MNVIILALNSKYIHSSLAPWYLKSAISEFDISCKVLEHTVNESLDNVFDDILSYKPEVLAISVYIWNICYTYFLINKIKSTIPNIKIILGGPEVSYNPSKVLENKDVDYVLCGEGEVPFENLCHYLFFGENIDFAGISSREKHSMPFIGSGTPKSPYTNEYFATLNNRIAYFESSRGCPYFCAYCLSGRCEGMRFFDIEYIRENLIKLANSGTKTIKFVDRTFNADRHRAFELFSFLIKNYGVLFPPDVCFHFELSGDLLDDETIELLSSAPNGLFQFEIGIQSFYPRTISAIHRKTDSEILKNRIRRLVNNGNAHIHTDLIAGLPFEDYDSFVESFNQAYELGANMLQLGFLKILHGTELEERANEYGFKYSNEPPYEVYETSWLAKADFKKLKIAEKAVDRIHNSGRFKRTIELCLPMFDSAYEFFYECGCATYNARNLDYLTNAVYSFLRTRFADFSEEIRDALVCDRLATNSSRGLPMALYRNDERIKEIKKRLNETSQTSVKSQVRRNIAILYHAEKAVYADYDKKNFNGEYSLNFVNLNDI